jgi:hypothetical protein
MKYLIITPDGVGSTFLQRTITAFLHLNGKDVINTHEISNGLNIENGKISRQQKANYSQGVNEIIDILKKSTSPYLVSRLAKYHLDKRNDSDFLILLNFIRSFYDKIIICKRKNIFEYALSWSLRNNTGYLNVYSLKQKREVRKKSDVDLEFFNKKLVEYNKYVEWISENFSQEQIIFYEDLILDPEKCISELVPDIEIKKFKEKFNISLKDYIYLEYNLHELAIKNITTIKIKEDIKKIAKIKNYFTKLVKEKIMPAGTIPIKNTSLKSKKEIILNYNMCVKNYKIFARSHNWIDQSIMEFDFWNSESL